MPIYEFYCRRCHTIYSFLSRRIDTEKVPPCPRGPGHRLQRRTSSFAIGGSGRGEGEGGAQGPEGPDDAAMMGAFEELAGQAEGLDEDDPRGAARLMRKLADRAGVDYGETMEEALRRMEAGEDPDSIEADLGAAMEAEEEPFDLRGRRRGRRPAAPPQRDQALYEM